MASSSSRILEVPAGDDDVPISLDELPSMQDDEWEVILSLLSGDSSSTRPHNSLWTRMAFEYFKTDREDHAIQLLTKGTEVLRGTVESSNLHSMLSFFFLNKAKKSPKAILNNPKYQDLKTIEKEKSYHLNDSNKHSSTSNTLSPKNPISVLNKALLLCENGKNDESSTLLEIVLNYQPKHTIALFAKACILLRKRNYQSALLIYQQLLKLTLGIDQKAKKRKESEMEEDEFNHQANNNEGGWKGPDPRIGIGLCLLGLNRPSDAIRAWKRAVVLNPNFSAPNLLLGLTALNTAKQLAPLFPGTYGYSPAENGIGIIGGCSEEEARQRAYKDGIDHIQKAWKGDNKNAMTAIILAEHIGSRASSLASSTTSMSNSEIMIQFNKALKLCEHAIQYADSRSAFIQASLIFARTSHLASNHAAITAQDSNNPIGSEIGNESVELRAQAVRNYQRVIDELSSQTSGSNNSLSNSQQSMNLVGGGNILPNGLALAVLSLAQLQVSRNEDLAAMNTLDSLLSKNWSNSNHYSVSSLLEPNILASSLRYFSHPGASTTEKQSDFIKAKIGLERTLRIINASCKEVHLRLISNDQIEEAEIFRIEMSKEEEEEEKDWENKRITDGLKNENVNLSRSISRTSLSNESLSLNSFKNIANLFNSSKIHVLMAQLCQKGHSDSDVERAIQEWKLASEKEKSILGIDLKDSKKENQFKEKDLNQLVSCLINQNALLALKGLEEKPDWSPLTKSNDDENNENLIGIKNSNYSYFSNPIRTEILKESVKNLEDILSLLSKIEFDQPISNSTNQYFSSSINDSNRLDIKPLRLIVSYNLARALEGLAEEIRAVKIYDEILSQHSEFTDAKVRKALIYLGGSSKSYSSKDGIVTSLLYSSNQGSSNQTLIKDWNKDYSNSLFKESLLSNPTSLSIRLSYVSFLSGNLPCSRSSTWSIVKDILAEPFLGPNPQGIALFGSSNNAKMMAEKARKDSFTLSALGWVYYNLALQAKPGSSNFKKEREKGMLRSSDLFDKALTENPRNCFAAQGLAILLAEDAIGEATFNAINSNSLNFSTKDQKLNTINKQLFSQVKYLTNLNVEQRRKLGAEESLNILGKLRELKDNEHVQICIGHANMTKEEYERAAKAFEQASSRYLCNSDPIILQQLSRATYAQATRTSSFELLETSLNHLKSSLKILEKRSLEDEKITSLKTDINYVRYNIAVISPKGLSMLYDKKCEKRDRGMIERAIKNVEEAQRIFESLAPIAAEDKLAHISAEVLDQRSQYGSTSLLRIANRHLNEQITYETKLASAREEVSKAKKEKEEKVLAQRREMEENLKEKNRLLAEQRKKEKEEVGTWEYRKDLPEDGGKRRAGGGGGERRKTKKRKDGNERDGGNDDLQTDEDDDDGLFGSNDKNGNVSSGESDLNDENQAKRREERIKDLKRKKMNEKKSKSNGGGEGGEKKKKKKKENKIKKKKGPQFSDEEDGGEEGEAEGKEGSGSGSDSDAPKRKKPKKAVSKKVAAQEDVIDSDEEI